jgi:hypothetical protein
MSGWWLACVCAAVCVLHPMAPANAMDEKSDSVTIPLDQIWAYQMPGMRDITTLERNRPPNYADGRLVEEIRRALADLPAKGKQAKRCFVVPGTGSSSRAVSLFEISWLDVTYR